MLIKNYKLSTEITVYFLNSRYPEFLKFRTTVKILYFEILCGTECIDFTIMCVFYRLSSTF